MWSHRTDGSRHAQLQPGRLHKFREDWLAKLTLIQDLLEQWIVMQRSWLYLEPLGITSSSSAPFRCMRSVAGMIVPCVVSVGTRPIFSSDDIKKQLVKETKGFEQARV